MATTVPGGRYLKADGKTWIDSEGIEIPETAEVAPAEVQPEPEVAPDPVVEPAAEPVKKAKK